jgi:succinoglycan biosynthesis protein ExoM
MHIDICVCTFRRPSIDAAMRSLSRQIVPAGVTLGLIIADNDETPSARERVEALAGDLSIPVTYLHAPARNISIARNACLDAARGDWVAFFDDDEIAPADWVGKLYKKAVDDDLDAVFGPAIAQYGEDTPDWIRDKDYHSNWPERRGRQVQTGHTCNAMIRLDAASVSGQRFLLEKGRTGGEDTEFFFRIWRAGARLGIADDAIVYEPVDPARLNFRWIMTRKYRSGISYGRHSLGARSLPARLGLFIKAGAKCLVSLAMSAATAWSAVRRNYWVLRAGFHAGVCSSVFQVKERELYGTA